ncbi:PKD-like family lipoprotein [Flavobacterium sp.]|uniref:PKD-like family lipoprotein n=1 Tax=Flavobacterium sp. TaxID=239 RepID=UPI00262AEC2C|nr:PKD-like family lipoprotein [Flavobacterium sp.]
MLENIKIKMILILLLLLGWGCTMDEGNYDYNAINELKITGIEEKYSTYAGEYFKIEPNLNPTMDDGKDPNRYTYEWVAVDPLKNVEDSKTIIAKTKNFEGILKLAPANYTLYYFVKDSVTGVTWKKVIELNVITSTYEGWLVVGDVDGKARLDMISILPGVAKPRIINDVLDFTGSALKLKGNAVDVHCFNNPIFTSRVYGIYVTASESGTARLDENSFAWTQSQNIAYESVGGALDTNFGVDFMKAPIFGGENLIYSKGNIYYYYAASQLRYGLPVNKVANETKAFYAAPFIAENSFSLGSSIFYDPKLRRFLRFSSFSGTCNTMPPVVGSATVLDWNNTNCDLVYMTTSDFNFNENFAVLKNISTSKYHLLRFNKGLTQTYYKEILNAPDFDKATMFAVSPDFGYLFYVVGGKLYEYDNGTQSAKLMLDKGAEQITFIGFDVRSKDFRKKLIVGSYGTTGKLELFTVPPVNGNLILDNSYSGLPKIVDVAFRAR